MRRYWFYTNTMRAGGLKVSHDEYDCCPMVDMGQYIYWHTVNCKEEIRSSDQDILEGTQCAMIECRIMESITIN